MTRTACVDLFCGAGGLTHGLIGEGIPVIAGIDVDERCRHPFEANNGARFIKKDIAEIGPNELRNLYGNTEIRILAGCAPCQPFSTYFQRYPNVTSARWSLLYQFVRLIDSIRPEIITMENVPLVKKHAVFNDFIASLKRMNYNIWQDVVDCIQYGLPQTRRRMVVVASMLGSIELISPTNERPCTVRDAIEYLPPIEAGGFSELDTFHTASTLSELNLTRIRASRPGGTWRDWPSQLVAPCHCRETGRTYPGVYGRMTWDDPSPTITTQFYGFGNGRFGHPVQDRAISLREGALLQGFPDTYSFVPDGNPIHFKALGRMIGNAVPVALGRVIGRSIARHLGVEEMPKGKVPTDACMSIVA